MLSHDAMIIFIVFIIHILFTTNFEISKSYFFGKHFLQFFKTVANIFKHTAYRIYIIDNQSFGIRSIRHMFVVGLITGRLEIAKVRVKNRTAPPQQKCFAPHHHNKCFSHPTVPAWIKKCGDF